MRHGDLQHATKFPDALESSTDKSLVEAREIREAYAAELVRLKLDKPSPVSMSALVVKLLSETTPLDSSKMAYSAYSSIAHSQLSGLDAFAASDRYGPETRLEAPLAVLTALSSQMALALLGVAKRLAVWVGGPNAPMDRIEKASNRAGMILSTLPDAAYSKDFPYTEA